MTNSWFKDLPQKFKDENKKYVHLSESGALMEQWEKINGKWVDVTPIIRAQEELRKAEEALHAARDSAREF